MRADTREDVGRIGRETEEKGKRKEVRKWGIEGRGKLKTAKYSKEGKMGKKSETKAYQ